MSQPHDAPSPPPPDQTHLEQGPQSTTSVGDRGSAAPSMSYASDGGSRPPASALAGAWDAKTQPVGAEPAAIAKDPADTIGKPVGQPGDKQPIPGQQLPGQTGAGQVSPDQLQPGQPPVDQVAGVSGGSPGAPPSPSDVAPSVTAIGTDGVALPGGTLTDATAPTGRPTDTAPRLHTAQGSDTAPRSETAPRAETPPAANQPASQSDATHRPDKATGDKTPVPGQQLPGTSPTEVGVVDNDLRDGVRTDATAPPESVPTAAGGPYLDGMRADGAVPDMADDHLDRTPVPGQQPLGEQRIGTPETSPAETPTSPETAFDWYLDRMGNTFSGMAERLGEVVMDLSRAISFADPAESDRRSEEWKAAHRAVYDRAGGGFDGVVGVANMYNPVYQAMDAWQRFERANRDGDQHAAGRAFTDFLLSAAVFAEAIRPILPPSAGGAVGGELAVAGAGGAIREAAAGEAAAAGLSPIAGTGAVAMAQGNQPGGGDTSSAGRSGPEQPVTADEPNRPPVRVIPYAGDSPTRGAQVEADVLREWEQSRVPDTADRFALREPLPGQREPRNTLNRIAGELSDRWASAQERNPQLRPLDTSMLGRNVEEYIRSHPNLRTEWDRLQIAEQGQLHPSIRNSSEWRRLPAEYRNPGPEEARALTREMADFRRGTVGDKKPDVVEFVLDQNSAHLTDVTLRAGSPWHAFKTSFYQQVISDLTGLRVTAYEYTGRPGGTPIVLPPR